MAVISVTIGASESAERGEPGAGGACEKRVQAGSAGAGCGREPGAGESRVRAGPARTGRTGARARVERARAWHW